MRPTQLLTALCGFALIAASPATAQTLRLSPSGQAADPARVQVGDTLAVEVWAGLDSTATAGMAFYVALPADAFEVIDSNPRAQVGIQPFAPGPLFAGAGQMNNALEQPVGAPGPDYHLLSYAVLFGAKESGRTSVTGHGLVATFRVRGLRPLADGAIRIQDDPVYETRLVPPDGIGEFPFAKKEDLQVIVADPSTAIRSSGWGAVKKTAD